MNTTVLPRQARDKHEITHVEKKRCVFRRLFLVSMGFCHPGLAFSKLNGYSEPAGIWMFNNNAQLTVRETGLLFPTLCSRTDQFTKTGSGQAEGKHSKTRDCFLR
jgi:hypothetical protein